MTARHRQSLVFATRNAAKLRELREIVAPFGFAVLALDDVGNDMPQVDETGATFRENAALKALSAYRATGGMMCVADDSGLCVDALDGAPGVQSARWSQGGDDANNAKLVASLAGIANRSAHYVCALVLVGDRTRWMSAPPVRFDSVDVPASAFVLEAEGRVDGEIIDTPQGTGGFGYDPYFWVPSLGATFATISAEAKHAMSHRGRAMRALVDALRLHVR